MSSGTSVWRETLARATRLRAVPPEASRPVAALELQDPAVTTLVRQLFSADRRSRILFAAVDGESRIQDLCERIGKALAALPGADVAVVHGAEFNFRAAEAAVGTSKPFPEPTSASHVDENLWRVPFSVFDAERKNATADRPALSAFHYLVFAARVSDCATPAFCKVCDGAVLVISANHTRREAALRAKETLLRCNAELLGAVLIDRVFPVPEAIYRRL